MGSCCVTSGQWATFYWLTWSTYDDVIKRKLFPRYWPFVRGIHRSPVNSPRKGQWRGALMFSLICAWINDWVNNGEAGDLRRYCAHCDVIEMTEDKLFACWLPWYSVFSSTLTAVYMSSKKSGFCVCAQPMRDGVTPSLIGWVHTQNYSREFELKVSTQFN